MGPMRLTGECSCAMNLVFEMFFLDVDVYTVDATELCNSKVCSCLQFQQSLELRVLGDCFITLFVEGGRSVAVYCR